MKVLSQSVFRNSFQFCFFLLGYNYINRSLQELKNRDRILFSLFVFCSILSFCEHSPCSIMQNKKNLQWCALYVQYRTWQIILRAVDNYYELVSWKFFCWLLHASLHLISFFNTKAIRIRVLIIIGTVGNQFSCCCNNTGIEFFISLPSSVNSSLYKIVWNFHRNSFNKWLIFCAFET